MIKIKKIHILSLANVLKPKIIMEILKEALFFTEREIEYITNEDTGFVIDFCRENSINVIKVDHSDISKSVDIIQKREPDLLICMGWNRIIPEEYLSIYKKSINCHSGLLPDYRGNRAYMPLYANIEDEYGTTIHYMTKEFDDGNIIKQAKLKMYLDETPLIIHRRICELTALILPEAVSRVEHGYEGVKQTGKARFFTELTRKDMDDLRHRNIENLRKGLPKEVAPHREWDL